MQLALILIEVAIIAAAVFLLWRRDMSDPSPPVPSPAAPPPPMPWYVLPGLAAMVLVIFAGTLVASCFFADTTLRTTMFTGAFSIAVTVVGFYFGSSSGSQKKDETISNATAALAVPTTKTEGTSP